MAIITSQEEIAKLRKSGQILTAALQEVVSAVKAGVTSGELNQVAEESIKRQGGQPAFSGYQDYPASLCVSINHEVVHGIPDPKRKIQDGDVVGLDLGVIFDGIYTDHAVTIGVGSIDPKAQQLLADTKAALLAGLNQVKAGNHIGDISSAIQRSLEKKRYGIVRQLTGHGVGHSVHESPSIPNFGKAGSGPVLKEGMVLAIEPMVTLGGWQVQTLEDGWTVETTDGSLAAHFEDTVRVTNDGFEFITSSDGKSSRT